MSRSVWTSSTSIRSIEPIVPPALPIAVATRPSMPGRWSILTRRTNENWACSDAVIARASGSVAEPREALGLGLPLGLALGAPFVVALLALALAVHVDDAHRGAEGAVAAVG